jgi:hypothetical protein
MTAATHNNEVITVSFVFSSTAKKHLIPRPQEKRTENNNQRHNTVTSFTMH